MSKVRFNIDKYEYQERLNRLSANSKSISDFTNELESGSYMNPQRRQKLKDELEQYQSDYEYLSFFSGVGEKERNQTFSDLKNLRNSLDTMQKIVEQVGGEEAYKNTVNNLAFTKKYKGKTYKELTDWIGSEAYNQSRHQGKVTEDEDKWLKNYAETIKYDEYSLDELKKMVDAAKQKKDENEPGLLQKAVDFIALGDFNAQNSGYIDDYKAKKAAYDKKRFSDLASREDYAQNSAYTSQNRYSNFSLSKPFGDIDKIVEFINADDERKNKILAFRSTGTAGAEVNNEQLTKYSNLTDDQKANLNYIYNTQGKEQAEEYLNYISPQINEQMTANEVAKTTQFADEHPILGTVRSFATNLGAGKGIVEDVLKNFKGENIDVNSPAHLDSQVTTSLRAKAGEKAGELLDWELLGTPIGTTLYGAATSIGDMAIDILIARGFGTLAGSAEAAEKMTGKIVQGIMSSQAATNGVIEAKNRGLSDNQSVTLGAIAGATEWLTEKYSIEAFLSDPKKTALYLAKNFVAEGSEEAASDILNTLADYIVAGDKSEFVQSMKTYMAEGKDEKSAFAAAAGDLAMEMGNDFLAGALAGGVMGGYGKISDNARLGSVGKDVSLRNNAGNLIQTGLRADRESEFYNQANELVNSKSVKNSDIGRLQLAAEAYAQDKLNQNAKTALKGIVTQYLENEGSDPQLSDRLSEVVVRAYAGEKLTVNERKIVNGNNHVASVLNTLKNVAGDIRPRALGQQLTNLLEKTEKNKLVDAALKKGESNERVAAAIKELQTPNSGLANALQLSEPVVNAELELSKIRKYKKIKNKTPSKLTTQDLKDVEVNDDGVTVNGTNLDELSFVDEKTSEAIAYAAEYGKLAQNYIDIYNMNPQQSLSEYAPAFELAYTYGRTAGTTLEMAQNSPSASLLQPEQLQAAFKMGQTARALEQENQTFKRRRGKKNSGVVKLPAGVKASSLSEQQNASIRALRKISDVTGIRFELYNSKAKNGTYTEANGYYKNGTVYLDINAGKNGVFDTNTAILQTAAHELTHFMSEYNAKMYGELQSFVVEHLNGFEGKSIEQRAIERMAEYDDKGVVLSFENAVEEITADACTQMLQDSKAMEQLAAENKSLFQKITDFLKELFVDIKKAFKGAYLGNEAKAMQQHMDELQKIWDKALVGAVKQHNNYELVQKNKGQSKYSYAGENAATANRSLLKIAQQKIENGESSEAVRKETGWFKGYDGKWRFEIDDLASHLIEEPRLERHEDDGEVYFTGKLSNILEHAELFNAYPELKNINIVIQPTSTGVQGIFQKSSNYITLSLELFKRHTKEYNNYLNGGRKAEIEKIEQTPEYKEYSKYHDDAAFENMDPEVWLREEKTARDKFFNSELGKRYYELHWGKNGFTGQKLEFGWDKGAKSVLMHELQHAVQSIEGFSKGASVKYWNDKMEAGYTKRNEKGTELLPSDLYDATAGEIESRDVEKRLNYTAEQRKNTRPDIDRKDVVFADGGVSYSTSKTFNEQIDEVLNGTHNPRLDLYVSETPEYLLKLNFPDSPILMRNSKISEILNKHSDMSTEIIKQIPKALENPLLVLKSKTHPKDSVVIVTDISTAKGDMIVPVWANQAGNYIDLDLGNISLNTNFVASAYGRNTASLIEYAVNNNGVLYQNPNIEKVSQLLARNGLQLPTPLKLTGSDITVPQNSTDVNTYFMQDGTKYSLRPYSQHQKDNWKSSKSIVVYENDAQLREFVKSELNNKQSNKKMYFGAIPADLAAVIRSKTGIDVKNYNCSISGYEIRKIFKDHGNEKTEALRGQRAITVDDIANIPAVVQSPEYIALSKKDYMGKPAIIMSKNINGNLTVVAVVSNKHLDLFVQTAYANNKKGNLATPTAEQAAVNTPKASSSTVSNNSLADNAAAVNTYFMSEDGKNSLRRAENSYEALGELEKLKKRNAALEQDIKGLNKALKLTKQLTHGKLVSPAQVRMVAEIIRKNAGSSYSSQKLAPRLEEVYNWLAAGKDVSYEAFYEKAVGIATDLAEDIRPAKVEIPYYKELTKAIRDCKIALSEQQKSEVAEIYGSYNEFRKQNMGKFTLTDKGTPLDVAWQELSKKYPGAFEQDLTEPEQPLQLSEIYDAARSASYYIEQVNTSEMVQQIAADIYDKFWNVSTMHTFADKKQQEITELKQKHNAKIRELRGEFQQTVQDTKAHYNEKLKNVRNSKMQQMQQMQQHGKQVVQNLRQRQMKTAKIRQIRDRLSEFAKKLDKPTVKKHIPLELQGMVAQLLEAFSYKTKQDLNISERLDRFKAKYSELETTYPSAYDENITKMLEALSANINNRTLRELDLKTLNKAYDVIRMVSGYITNSNKLFRETRSKAITESGQKIVFEEKSRARLIRKSFEEWGITQWLMRQGLKVFKPRTLFKMVGSEELMHLYENLRAGEDVFGADCNEALKRYRNAFEQSGFKLKEGDEVKTLYLEKGGKQNFTVQELMFLYAATKREAYRKHLTVGGYVHEKAVKVEKHKVSIDKTPVQLTEADFVTVNNALTQKQKQFVDDLQSYLSKELAAKGNEVSRQLYTIDQFTDKNYWPIRSSKNFLPVKAKDKNAAPSNPKNRGFTKEPNEKAVNPIVLGDFTSVWAEHVSEMAIYHALTLPLEDFRRVYEYHGTYETDENGLKPASGVRVAIENAWGKHVTDAIETFYRDVCGGVRVADASVENKLLGLAKKGAVLANLSVAIQQPSAIGRATALVPEKYLIKSTAMKRDYEKVKKYAPVAVLKEMGYFNISLSRTLESYLNSNAQAPEGVVGKVAAFVDPKNSDYRDNVFGYLPGKMDELTWCHIWNAVELMVKDTGRFNTESEAFYQECGRQFTKVITETQVYDSVFSRCELRRSKNGAVQMAVAFMDEPITSLNMLIDGVIDGTRLGGREGAKCIFKAAKAVFIAGVLNAVSVSLIRAMRDDDEDKTYIEKYLGAIPANFLDSINPLGMIPYVKDLWSVYQGYDLNRMDMSALSGIVNALKDLGDENKSVGEKVKDLVVSVSTLTGIPLRNILRDTEGLINTIFNSKPLSETSLAGITESMQENILGELKSADFVNSYGKAVLNEDFEGAESKLNRMKEKAENKRKANYPNESSAEREKAVNSSMRAAFTRYYKNLYISGNEKKRKEIRMIMGRSKLYGTSGDIAKICKKWLADYEEEENKKNIF